MNNTVMKKAIDLNVGDYLTNYEQISKVIKLDNDQVQIFTVGSNYGRIVNADKLIEVIN